MNFAFKDIPRLAAGGFISKKFFTETDNFGMSILKPYR
jgi:hypothetical protein